MLANHRVVRAGKCPCEGAAQRRYTQTGHGTVIIRPWCRLSLDGRKSSTHVLVADHLRFRQAVLRASERSGRGRLRQHQGLARHDARVRPATRVGRFQAGPSARTRCLRQDRPGAGGQLHDPDRARRHRSAGLGVVQDSQAGREVRRPLFAGHPAPGTHRFRPARLDAGAGRRGGGGNGHRPAAHEHRPHDRAQRQAAHAGKRSRPSDARAVPRHLFRPPGYPADVPAQGSSRSWKRPSTVAARPVWWCTRSC